MTARSPSFDPHVGDVFRKKRRPYSLEIDYTVWERTPGRVCLNCSDGANTFKSIRAFRGWAKNAIVITAVEQEQGNG